MTLPRLIATDLDGTLLGADGLLSARTADALRAAAAAGIIVVFASGRPPFVATREIDAAAGAVRYGVMANGSIVCTLPDGDVLRSIDFPASEALDVARTLRAADPRFGFALATDTHFAAEPGFFERMPVGGAMATVPDALDGHHNSRTAIKLLVFHHDMGAMALLQRVPEIIGDRLTPTHMGAEAIELGPVGADKGTGLAWLCNHLHVDAADVVVFGDEINDLAMIRFAGRSVAVANAVDEVRAAADEICPANTADGVAVWIETLLGS